MSRNSPGSKHSFKKKNFCTFISRILISKDVQLIKKLNFLKTEYIRTYFIIDCSFVHNLMFCIVLLQPHLTIPSATYKDAGLYICTASNGIVTADIPKIILVVGAVPFFNQAPYSFLALPTLSNGYLTLNIEITFKPENANGELPY